MQKALIIPGNSTPGFGGLNRFALLEDGWKQGMIVDVVCQEGNKYVVR